MDLYKLPDHPFAGMFPRFRDEVLDDLCRDISINGLMVPVVIYQDRVLDGRHRLRACEAVGVDPRWETFSGDDHQAFNLVVSLNLNRRHLSEAQRATCAATAWRTNKALRKAPNPSFSANLPKMSQRDWAEKFNVSVRSVRSAASILDHEELKGAVLRDELSVLGATKALSAMAPEPAESQSRSKISRRSQEISGPSSPVAIGVLLESLAILQEMSLEQFIDLLPVSSMDGVYWDIEHAAMFLQRLLDHPGFSGKVSLMLAERAQVTGRPDCLLPHAS